MAKKHHEVAKLIAVGGGSGWCAGYLFRKVGEVVVPAVGGGILLLQIANKSGYIKINWKQMEKDVSKACPELKSFTDESILLVKENTTVTSAFIGGFLLGLAS